MPLELTKSGSVIINCVRRAVWPISSSVASKIKINYFNISLLFRSLTSSNSCSRPERAALVTSAVEWCNTGLMSSSSTPLSSLSQRKGIYARGGGSNMHWMASLVIGSCRTFCHCHFLGLFGILSFVYNMYILVYVYTSLLSMLSPLPNR